MSAAGIINNRTVHYIAAKECEFTVRGENLVTLRRAKLRLIAKALNVQSEGPKNEVLHRVLSKLRATDSPKELAGI